MNIDRDNQTRIPLEGRTLFVSARFFKAIAVLIGLFILLLGPIGFVFACLYFIPNRAILKRKWTTYAYFIATLIPPLALTFWGFANLGNRTFRQPDALYDGLQAMGWIMAVVTISAPLSLWFTKRLINKFQPRAGVYQCPASGSSLETHP
jgi:hypothetical protein